MHEPDTWPNAWPDAWPKRRTLIAAGALGLLGLPHAAHARDSVMREVLDLGAAARSAKLPFVLLLSIAGCPFCEFVRRSYLLPMNRENSLDAWQLSLDRTPAVRDFGGQSSKPRDWAYARGHRQTPTVLFMQATGPDWAEPLVGVVSSQMYGEMLNQRLMQAPR